MFLRSQSVAESQSTVEVDEVYPAPDLLAMTIGESVQNPRLVIDTNG
jgi:hypothetical protein